jgi:GNAT superfamily N-acetyltransferase
MFPAQEFKISVHYIDTVVLMSEDGLSFQICKVSDDSESLRNDQRAVVEGLLRYNESKTGFAPKGISVFMQNRENRIVGGILGFTLGDWLHIDILWVEESFRNKGNGTELLKMAENEAIKRGCKRADLDTFSFPRPFYEKNGYTVFGTLDNVPEGYRKYFMKKDLP